jgi:hypothetical protein
MYIYKFLLRMTDTMTPHIDLSSWDALYVYSVSVDLVLRFCWFVDLYFGVLKIFVGAQACCLVIRHHGRSC